MRACKSKYNYEQLCNNYIEANINTLYDVPVSKNFTSTAEDRMSFDKDLLISYSTPVARIIKDTNTTYLFITNTNYSVTTTKQLNILKSVVRNYKINIIHTNNIWNTFLEVIDEYIQLIHKFYTKDIFTIRKLELHKSKILNFKSTVEQLYKEIPKERTKQYIEQLNKYPELPNKLNKFTKKALYEYMKDKGLL